jgi:hypothetical protein
MSGSARSNFGPQVIVSDQQVEAALDLLATDEVAFARGEMIFAEGMIKHIRALEMVRSDAGSAAAREREAEASDRYKGAIDTMRDAAIRLETAKARREHAVMVIEVWRSQQATRRIGHV